MNIFQAIENLFSKAGNVAQLLPVLLALITAITTAAHTRSVSDIENAIVALATTADTLGVMKVPAVHIQALEEDVNAIIEDLKK